MTTTVGDVMTRCPVSAAPDTSFATLAGLLAHQRISAVPVVDEAGRPVGVVSGADLFGAAETATARELMTGPPRTVDQDVALPTAARALLGAGVRRLLVTERGRLVGVLSRRDLLTTYLVDDEVVREQVRHALATVLPGDRPAPAVSVRDGVVLLLGRVEWRSAKAAVDACVRAVPGVVEVVDRLGYVFDDHPRRQPVGSGR